MALSEESKPVNSRRKKIALYALGVGLAVAGVALVAAAGWFAYRAIDRSPANQPAAVVCTDNTLARAAPLLASGETQQLQPIVAEIEATDNFTQDPNCLYIVVQYYIGISDAANARRYFNDLEKVYNPQTSYSDFIVSGSLPPQQLKPIIEFLEQRPVLPDGMMRGPRVPAE